MQVDRVVFKVKAFDSLSYAAETCALLRQAGTGLCSLLVVQDEMKNKMVEATWWETNSAYLKPSQKKRLKSNESSQKSVLKIKIKDLRPA